MKKMISAVITAAGVALAASTASANIIPQGGPVTVNLVVDAFQTLPATNCTATVTGNVSGHTLTLNTAGVTFAGAFPCTAITMTSNIAINYTHTTASTTAIAVTGINTTSAAGNCSQGSTPITGTAGYAGGSAAGVIPGTPGSCQFGVTYTNAPVFTAF